MILRDINQKLVAPNSRANPNDVPTMKDVVLDSVMHSKTQNGAESIRCLRLGEKIEACVSDLDLLPEEYEIVKRQIDTNPMSYFAWVHGQAMAYLLRMEQDNVIK